MIDKLIQKATSFLGEKEPTGDDQFIKYYNDITGAGFSMTVAWCAIFVTVIARMVGVSTSVIPTFADCDAGKNWFKNKGRYEKGKHYGGTYTPKRGDVVFYSGKYTQSDSTHVGYVVSVSGGRLTAIEGNKSDAVAYRSISLSNSYIIGYGRVADFLGEGTDQEQSRQCYQKYTGSSYGIDTVFRAIGVPEQYLGGWKKRQPIAEANGISGYTGTAEQNTKLISLAKQGALRKVGAAQPPECYPAYSGTATTLDSILKAVGVPAEYRGSWAKRKPLAEANGISGYTGTAVQNTKLIGLAKQGKLKKVK